VLGRVPADDVADLVTEHAAELASFCSFSYSPSVMKTCPPGRANALIVCGSASRWNLKFPR
jgi:hypothetical protein